jgi:hypothetical protein
MVPAGELDEVPPWSERNFSGCSANLVWQRAEQK